jgi:hypothetical protein
MSVEASEQESYPSAVSDRLAIRIFLLITTLVLLILLFVFENPTSGGPKVVISALTLIFAVLFQVSWLLIITLSKVAPNGIKVRHPFLLSQLIAFGGIFLLGLQSLNQLSITDALLMILLGSLTYFYILRRF